MGTEAAPIHFDAVILVRTFQADELILVLYCTWRDNSSQIIEGKNSRRVSISPNRLDRIVADTDDLLQLKG